MIPKAKSTQVALARGGIITLPLCAVCQKPEISAKDEEKLRREKVQLGRCRCTPKEKSSASQVSNGPVTLPMYEGRARHTDPDTSHEAAAKAKTGKVGLLLLGALIESNAPLTYGDVAERTGKREVCVSPCFRLLEKRGLIERVQKVIYPTTHAKRWTWKPTEHGRAVFEANRA